jgi:hypothetical protein
MLYIESAFNDGYMRHHGIDDVFVVIHHRPEDGYFLSANQEIIKERLSLREFLARLIHAERKAKTIDTRMIEDHIREVQEHLRLGKSREIGEWLEHRYIRVIRNKDLVLAQHNVSYWDEKRFQQALNQSGLEIRDQGKRIVQQPMTPDEAYKICDDNDIYYLTS